MSEISALFDVLRQSADLRVAAAIQHLAETGEDRDLNRINVLAFATAHGLGADAAISGFVRAARLGLFDMSWNVLCPGCGGVLNTNLSLKSVRQQDYHCALCAAGYEASLDEMVEVTFTVARRLRHIAAHNPESLPFLEYFRQVFWSSGIDLQGCDLGAVLDGITLDALELPAGEKASLSLNLPAEFLIVFEPVTHSAQFIDVRGGPTRERQNLSLVFNKVRAPTGTVVMAPGPLRLYLENATGERVLPAVWIGGDALHALLGKRRPFLTANALMTNQTFRDLYGAETMDVDQRLKITSLTILFTDLKGSTELYERVGDLAAFDLVRAHFALLQEIVASEAGAVVKTIGDAVMATFPSPDRALAAALRMRTELEMFNTRSHKDDLIIKIGIHEGPCLAVTLNDRQDYFGQTVNVAARVQKQSVSSAIFATGAIVAHPGSVLILQAAQLTPLRHERQLHGLAALTTVYEIPQSLPPHGPLTVTAKSVTRPLASE